MLSQCFTSPNVSRQPTSSYRSLYSFPSSLLCRSPRPMSNFLKKIRYMPDIAVLYAYFAPFPGSLKTIFMAVPLRHDFPGGAICLDPVIHEIVQLPCGDSRTWQLRGFGAPWYGDAVADAISCPVSACRLGVALACALLLGVLQQREWWAVTRRARLYLVRRAVGTGYWRRRSVMRLINIDWRQRLRIVCQATFASDRKDKQQTSGKFS